MDMTLPIGWRSDLERAERAFEEYDRQRDDLIALGVSPDLAREVIADRIDAACAADLERLLLTWTVDA
jgi:hypothetical protein